MSAVLDLCDQWDKGDLRMRAAAATVRAAYAEDVLTGWPTCGQRALVPGATAGGPALYTEECVLAKGHTGGHQDVEGYGWQESVR